MNAVLRLKIPLSILFVLWLSGCAFIEPRAATDPAYIASHQKERRYWEKRAAQVYMGMTRREVEQLLPPDMSLSGISSTLLVLFVPFYGAECRVVAVHVGGEGSGAPRLRSGCAVGGSR